MTKSLNWLANQRLLLQNPKWPLLYRLYNVSHLILFQYIDPIIAATWSEDGAIHDVCKALAPRIREPNTIVRLIAHWIIYRRTISTCLTDRVQSLDCTSHDDTDWRYRQRTIISIVFWSPTVTRYLVWKLGRSVNKHPYFRWHLPQDHHRIGYATPQNLQVYALYLNSRIRAYKDLKHDAIRVQDESNRDLRTSISIEEDRHTTTSRKDRSKKPPAASLPTRSKTITGRKLRSMTVEKGLLRETKVVHNMIDALVECRVCPQWFIIFGASNLFAFFSY